MSLKLRERIRRAETIITVRTGVEPDVICGRASRRLGFVYLSAPSGLQRQCIEPCLSLLEEQEQRSSLSEIGASAPQQRVVLAHRLALCGLALERVGDFQERSYYTFSTKPVKGHSYLFV